MTDPKRRPQRRPHLDAHLVSMERALHARAAELQDEATRDVGNLVSMVKAGLAAELARIAEELHWW